MTDVLDRPASLDWDAIAQAGLPEVVTLRRSIHADPELGLDCPRTRDKIKAALAGLPLEYKEGPSTTGLVAILRGGRGNGRTVLLRGDMDALPMQEETGLEFSSQTPGRMHACGHDAHTAMLVGAAKALCAKRDALAGTVVFMFQPGEEGHKGARHMMDDGLLADPAPDAAFALHIMPNAPRGVVTGRPGPMMASTDTVNIVVKGRGGHAAMPHESRDPIPVACEIVMALQAYVARQVAVTDPAVLTITRITAGTTHNVIPSEAALLGTLRTLSAKTRAAGREAVRRIAEHVALAHDMTAQVSLEEGYPVTVNDPRAVDLTRRTVSALWGEEDWRPMAHPVMGGEDFSYVLEETPGSMSFLGVAPEGEDAAKRPPLHNTRMVLDEGAMARGVALHCALAERFLDHGFD